MVERYPSYGGVCLKRRMTAYADTWEKRKILIGWLRCTAETKFVFYDCQSWTKGGKKRGKKDRVESICFEFNPVRLMICILRGKEKFFLFVLCDKQDRWLIIIMIMIILFWALNNIDYTWHIFRKETTDFNIN